MPSFLFAVVRMTHSFGRFIHPSFVAIISGSFQLISWPVFVTRLLTPFLSVRHSDVLSGVLRGPSFRLCTLMSSQRRHFINNAWKLFTRKLDLHVHKPSTYFLVGTRAILMPCLRKRRAGASLIPAPYGSGAHIVSVFLGISAILARRLLR